MLLENFCHIIVRWAAWSLSSKYEPSLGHQQKIKPNTDTIPTERRFIQKGGQGSKPAGYSHPGCLSTIVLKEKCLKSLSPSWNFKFNGAL